MLIMMLLAVASVQRIRGKFEGGIRRLKPNQSKTLLIIADNIIPSTRPSIPVTQPDLANLEQQHLVSVGSFVGLRPEVEHFRTLPEKDFNPQA